MTSNSKRLFVVDTDAGVDDAQAIMMMLARSDIELLAVTTVRGNTTTEQVTKNVLRLLKLAGRLDIEVYKGAVASLINQDHPSSAYYHGEDGFGDVPDQDPPDLSLVQSEHGVNALIRLVNLYPGEINLICLGPLTNVALALRLDPDFGSKLKDCFIMGGNYHGKGNINVSAEFNFYADPEAASVVLKDLGRVSTLVTWELCMECALKPDFYERFTNTDSEMARIVKEAEGNAMARRVKTTEVWRSIADQLLAAVAVERMAYCMVELVGAVTRGQMVVDWRCELCKDANVRLVLDVDKDKFAELMMTIVQH
ncbi:putative uridine nucleosidase 1 [Lamellibrachia satsuma]|nr:putative uridine nucleosidase 1 [Lamellibrachia satsuma]